MSSSSELSVVRHSAAHLLAHALSELFPDVVLTIGPATKEGFFYDVQLPFSLKESDFPAIVARMQDIVARDLPLEHRQISKTQAREIFKGNPFKLELIEGIPGDEVGLATQGAFYDLCRGGHVARTSQLAHFKLLHLSGAYWRADRANAVLQRITGTAFRTAEELGAYERHQAELAAYDHRVLGKELDLFSFQPEGAGFPFFHPKGKAVLNTLVRYMRALQKKYGYQEIETPTMLSDGLWQRSGHYEHYKENMYFSCVDDESYAIKPMNCPGAILTYAARPRSYRELPLKLSEFGHVHRHELSGALHGLLRVRAFTQDDAHIFCTHEQMAEQIGIFVQMVHAIQEHFGFARVQYMVSTRPASSIGSDELWEQGTQALYTALRMLNIAYDIEAGGGAFYGPKLSFYLEDSLGRTWQCGTMQVDFFQPQNFDLSYVTSQGTKARPVIFHQANFGSLERFFAVLLEHTKGNLPLWIAPVQIRVLTLGQEQHAYAQELAHWLQEQGVRVEVDGSDDPLKGKIKDASVARIPWMLVVGQKEMAARTVTVRCHDGAQHQGLDRSQLWELFLRHTHNGLGLQR